MKARQIETRNSSLEPVGESGEFSGYIAVWDTVDSYNSTFARGAFRKTISERGDRVKVLYNHESLIGRAVELREDERGVFARGRINLDLQLGRDVHALMRAGDLDGLSFAFQVFADEYGQNGLRTIKEVRLLEFGPVDFPANESAVITGVRAEAIESTCLRSVDFAENYGQIMDSIEPSAVIDALMWAFADIMRDDAIEDKRAAMLATGEPAVSRLADVTIRAWTRDDDRASAIDGLRKAGGPLAVATSTRMTAAEAIRAAIGLPVACDVSCIGAGAESLQREARQSVVDTLLAVSSLLTAEQRAAIRSAVGAAQPRRPSIASIWQPNQL